MSCFVAGSLFGLVLLFIVYTHNFSSLLLKFTWLFGAKVPSVG